MASQYLSYLSILNTLLQVSVYKTECIISAWSFVRLHHNFCFFKDFARMYKMLYNATSSTSNMFVNSSVADRRISTKDVKSKFSHCIWMKQSWRLYNQTRCCPQASVCFLKALQRQSLAVKVTSGATVTAREWRDSS